MNNAEIASQLLRIAELLSLEKESRFKARAYERAARVIAAQPVAVTEMLEQQTLRTLPGIGASIEGVVGEIVARGTSRLQTALQHQYPQALVELTEVPGITLDRARRIYDTLGVENLAQLEAALADGRILTVKGFGPKVSARVAEALERRRTRPPRFNIARASRTAVEVANGLRDHHPEARVEIAGDVRRQSPLCDEVVLVVGREGDASPVLDSLARLPLGGRLHTREHDRATWITHDGIPLTVIVVAPRALTFTRLLHTATPAVREFLLTRSRDEPVDQAETEDEIFAALGLPYVPPELLESVNDVLDIEAHGLPALIVADDMRGDLHAHTEASDGRHTIEEMAAAARALGYEYLAITDHSRSLAIASGLSIEEIRAQGRRIDSLQRDGLRILKGTECDILPDGSLDFPDDVLVELDVVVASVHSHFRIDRDTQTRRIIRAMENPYVDVIGHASGRLLQSRDPYDLDWDAVLAAAARTGTALEMNASPARLDIDAAYARRLVATGGVVSIDSDAHSTGELASIRFGVGQARRARLGPTSVINTRPLATFLDKRKRVRE